MTTLIAKYLAFPTQENAKRLVSYLRKHPMAEVMADNLERALIVQACRDLVRS